MAKDASVHPKTVTAVSRGEKLSGSVPKRARRSSKVTLIAVDPRIWETAKKLAEGDPHRIEVINASEVIVHNHPRRNR